MIRFTRNSFKHFWNVCISSLIFHRKITKSFFYLFPCIIDFKCTINSLFQKKKREKREKSQVSLQFSVRCSVLSPGFLAPAVLIISARAVPCMCNERYLHAGSSSPFSRPPTRSGSPSVLIEVNARRRRRRRRRRLLVRGCAGMEMHTARIVGRGGYSQQLSFEKKKKRERV